MPEAKYPHLNLREWPFQVVPDDRFLGVWADRKDVLNDVQMILNTLLRREQSTINILWAWFGAGKSHTLKHISFLCHTYFQGLLPVYIEFPRTVSSFRDLYIYFATAIDDDIYRELAKENMKNNEIKKTYPEFHRAMKLLRYKNQAQQRMGLRWIRGAQNLNATIKKAGIEKPIETSDDAVRAMACIVKMIGVSPRYHRLIWMIDEFQRIRAEKQEVYKALNTGLHSVFNACPNNLSMFFSFSVKEKQEIFPLLSKELIDRIGIQKVIEIKEFNFREAMNFVADLLFIFRDNSYTVPFPFFPFEEEAAKFIISLIEQNSDLKPRAIMQYFNAVMEQADFLIARGEIRTISIEFARKVLLDYDLFLSFQKVSLLK